MGIYDSDYYQGSKNRFIDSFAGTGQVCKWLIIINVAAFFIQMFTMPRGQGAQMGPFTSFFWLDTQRVFHGEIWRLLTYAFLHSPDILHIVFNMLFLWWFGRELEQMYGSREFLTFYLIAALLGGIGYTAYAGVISWQAFGNPAVLPRFCLGASGAVTAVMLVYACYFPQRTILLFFILPVPIWVLVGFNVVQDLFIFASGSETTTAVTVHLSGALFGFLYYKFGWRLTSLASGFGSSLRRRRSRPRLRVYHGEDHMSDAMNAVTASPPVDEQLEAKLDAVLEKIKTSGKESLSESEHQLLLRASEIYRKRREGV